MFYPKNQTPCLSKELFLHPTAEYRGAPFWAWNTKLDKEVLLDQISCMEQMGMGGFHIHSRIGLDTEYLGEEFLELVKVCDDEAKRRSMLCWLYDEDRWPSGSGGGRVSCHPEYQNQFLLITHKQRQQGYMQANCPPNQPFGRLSSAGTGTLLARYQIQLQDSCLQTYRRLTKEELSGDDTWYVYQVTAQPSPWFNDQPYVDTLNPEAIKTFLQVTHECYRNKLGHEFSHSIPAIFTDEPQFTRKMCLPSAQSSYDAVLPYTENLEQSFLESYGHSLLDSLPELIWELPNHQISQTRYQFHNHISELFCRSFADTIGNWCQKYGLMLTGHMMEEPTLEAQTEVLGDVMRPYRSFGLPGIDMLANHYEYTTAKQAQSASQQYGRPGVLSELYGVTNWDFDFRGHKLQGDWQAALGVTTRVHHLYWMGMQGEAKRDYPASIGEQSPWWKQYHIIEDHFARVNTAMTRGQQVVRVGVIHPIESYWLYYGPNDQTISIREALDEQFQSLTQWLLFGLIDFHFIDESLFPSQVGHVSKDGLQVGEMCYHTILVPGLKTIRSSTLEQLECFSNQGGHVLFLGEFPSYVDALPSNRAKQLASRCQCIDFSRGAVISALETERLLEIRDENGRRAHHLIYQMRQDGDGLWLFLANGKPVENPDLPHVYSANISVRGNWTAQLFDTLTGKISSISTHCHNNWTTFSYQLYEHDSLLIHYQQSTTSSCSSIDSKAKPIGSVVCTGPVRFTLEEPNVLLLDQAEFCLDQSGWMPKTEILKIDNWIRQKLHFPLRTDTFVQPWLTPVVPAPKHTVQLRYHISSQIALSHCTLALEQLEQISVWWNGQKVPSVSIGNYVDRAIQTLSLGPILQGDNVLLLEIPFGLKTNLEACYLLGDFGVEVRGRDTVITSLPDTLSFGDCSVQGLSFYGGNFTYHLTAETPECHLLLEASKYRAPLLTVSLDGGEAVPLIFSPYQVDLGLVSAGTHQIDLTCYGSRINTFGQLHNCNEHENYFGSGSWRSVGAQWSEEYQLRRIGVLKAPELHFLKY